MVTSDRFDLGNESLKSIPQKFIWEKGVEVSSFPSFLQPPLIWEGRVFSGGFLVIFIVLNEMVGRCNSERGSGGGIVNVWRILHNEIQVVLSPKRFIERSVSITRNSVYWRNHQLGEFAWALFDRYGIFCPIFAERRRRRSIHAADTGASVAKRMLFVFLTQF